MDLVELFKQYDLQFAKITFSEKHALIEFVVDNDGKAHAMLIEVLNSDIVNVVIGKFSGYTDYYDDTFRSYIQTDDSSIYLYDSNFILSEALTNSLDFYGIDYDIMYQIVCHL